MKHTYRVSIIIPTLNEASYLPLLLNALKKQSLQPYEVIIADAGSKDDTTAIAKRSGATVVPGGMPGVGRNAGAQVAKGDVFLFLDADVIPPPNFLKRTMREFQRSNASIASCLVEPIDRKLNDTIIMEATNLYMQVVKPFSPRAPGFCIFVKREIHEKIHGFDETLTMSEDHDYARRASAYGPFQYLGDIRIPVSMRRLEKEGVIQLALKYLWTELYALTGTPVRSTPFTYEFGTFDGDKKKDKPILTNITELRKKLGSFANPINSMSVQGVRMIRTFLSSDPSQISVQQIRKITRYIQARKLYLYLEKRAMLLKKNRTIRFGWKTIRSIPKECIRILNTYL